jgi:murein L,D-transpeptidase YcbB/YkuD
MPVRRPFYTRLRFILPALALILTLLVSTAEVFPRNSWIPAAFAGQGGAETTLDLVLNRGRAMGESLANIAALRAFYAPRGHTPVWISGWSSGYQRRVKEVLSVLEDSWTHGLNPEDYHVVALRSVIDEKSDSEVNRDELDVILSDAMVRYARDLTGARIDRLSNIRKKDRYWRETIDPVDILSHVAGASNIKNALRAFEPEGKLYAALRSALKDEVQNPEETFARIPGGGLIRPGDSSPRIPKVRARFGMAGEGNFYDDALGRKVMAFQEAHGLPADGVIGGQTLSLLNATQQDRINQILANLERLRWIDQDKPGRYVLVNIPSATLWAVEEGRTVLQMPVVVGKPKRPTVAFRTQITGIRFNPNWTVPPTIKQEDFLPALQEDPMYLSKRGIELQTGSGRDAQTLDPNTVDWAAVTPDDLKGITMTQSPGSSNPLGRVRVIMPNAYNIYLHDTNTPSYFGRSNRTLSSGCIRVSEPVKLADFILKNKQGWSQGDTDSALSKRRMADIMVDAPLPVYLMYQTAWQAENGGIVFGPDVYGEDAALARQLRAIGGVYVPKFSIKNGSKAGETSLAPQRINS